MELRKRQLKEAGEGVYGSEPGIYFLRKASQGMANPKALELVEHTNFPH